MNQTRRALTNQWNIKSRSRIENQGGGPNLSITSGPDRIVKSNMADVWKFINRYREFESLVSWKALRKIVPNKGAADCESLGRRRPRGSKNRRALINADRKSKQSQEAAAGQLRLRKVGLGRSLWRRRWRSRVCLWGSTCPRRSWMWRSGRVANSSRSPTTSDRCADWLNGSSP